MNIGRSGGCHSLLTGLKIPPGCELVVGGEPQCWAEGHCLLVDDSFLHTVAHNGNRTHILVGWGTRAEEFQPIFSQQHHFTAQPWASHSSSNHLWGISLLYQVTAYELGYLYSYPLVLWDLRHLLNLIMSVSWHKMYPF